MKLAFGIALMCGAAWAAGPDEMGSQFFGKAVQISADPRAMQWKDAPRVVTETDRYGKPVPGARTEIRSFWTLQNLHFLFISKYDSLYLKPPPMVLDADTWGLWDWDVVEVFIGSDLKNIGLYKEFEVSPQNEWVDLDVKWQEKGPDVEAKWNSGMWSKTRIDRKAKVWYCEMQIPWKALFADGPPSVGQQFRLNLYRIEGGPKVRKYITWRPVNNESYHTPQAFGRLRLLN